MSHHQFFWVYIKASFPR